jgi:hypothetical protein
VFSNPDRCPADAQEVAEAYCLGTLGRAEAAVFEDHCIACRSCAAAVQDAETYVHAMKAAAQRLRPARARSAGGKG